MKQTNNLMYCIVLPLILVAIAAYVFFGMCLPEIQNKNTLNNGKETTADITGVNLNQGFFGGGKLYIQFTFKNDSGKTIATQTNDAYSAEKLEEMGIITITDGKIDVVDNKIKVVEDQTIQIKYSGDKAVAKDYIAKNDITTTAVASVGIVLLGAAMFVVFFMFIKKTNTANLQTNKGDGVKDGHLDKQN